MSRKWIEWGSEGAKIIEKNKKREEKIIENPPQADFFEKNKKREEKIKENPPQADFLGKKRLKT